MNSPQGTLLIHEVAEILRISKTKAYELARQRVFPVIKIDRSLRVPAVAFYQWLNSQSYFSNTDAIN